VRAALEGSPGQDAVTRAMVATCHRWDIPSDQVDAFLEAMARDLDVTGYATYADLQDYMYGSAEVVGLWMLPLLAAETGADTGELEEPARRLGEAFQLTNFVRDVGEDLDLGRVYLPAEDLERYGVTRDDLLRVRRGAPVTDPLRALLAFEVQRCRRLYDEAAPGVERLDRVARPAIRAALVLYREILDRVEASDYAVLTRRVSVPRARRAAVALPALLFARRERRQLAAWRS
jgi:phytoene synthase